MGLLRALDHNHEQIVWAEQTEIELEKLAAVYVTGGLSRIEALLAEERQ